MVEMFRTPFTKAAFWAVRAGTPTVTWLADRGTVLMRDRLSSRHFVTSAYVVYDEKILLIHHRGLDRWLAPGGHMAFGETPDECAVREVREETGLVVQIVDGETGERCYREAGVKLLHQPLAVQLEQIARRHEHMDLVYAAVASNDNVIAAEREIIEFRWFTGPELAAAELDENVKIFGARALALGRLHHESS